jgi:hypothetical protein
MPNVLANPLANTSLNELLPQDVAAFRVPQSAPDYDTENLCVVSEATDAEAWLFATDPTPEDVFPVSRNAADTLTDANTARNEERSFELFDEIFRPDAAFLDPMAEAFATPFDTPVLPSIMLAA